MTKGVSRSRTSGRKAAILSRPRAGKTGGLRKPNRYPRARDDFYSEDIFCVRALILAETRHGRPFTTAALDPACGYGTIPQAFLEYGLTFQASDKRDRVADMQRAGTLLGFNSARIIRAFRQFDFLQQDGLPYEGVEDIVCNPPYGRALLARAFIEKAVPLARRACFLVNSQFLYGQERHAFYSEFYQPARIYHMSQRPSMPPAKAFLSGRVKRGGGRQDFSWIVYDRDHKGPPPTFWLMGETEPGSPEAYAAQSGRPALERMAA
jgi:hypothetical protein